MTIGNETYESIKEIPFHEGLALFVNFMNVIKDLFNFDEVLGKNVINHEEIDDEFADFLKIHNQAMENTK